MFSKGNKRKKRLDDEKTYPCTLSKTVETKLIGNFRSIHSILSSSQYSRDFGERDTIARAYRKILFIGKDQEHSIPQLILIQHTLQLLTSFRHTVTIVAINNEDDTLRILEVMPPERSDLILSTNIPHGKLDVFVFNSLYVEACRRVSTSLVGDEMDEADTNQWLG